MLTLNKGCLQKPKEQKKLGKARKLTKEEDYQLSVESVRRIKPQLEALEQWQRESINQRFRII